MDAANAAGAEKSFACRNRSGQCNEYPKADKHEDNDITDHYVFPFHA